MLKIENLTKSYGDKKAVDNLSLHVQAGEIYGFIGHNGAGKTTTLKACCGILAFEEGEIFVDGVSVRKDPIAVKGKIAYVPDNPDLDIAKPYEPHIAELPDGTLVGAIRIEIIAPGRPKELTIYMTYSYDGGKTFTTPTPTGINGTPPHLLLLKDGRLLMSYGRREEPCGSRARISEDGGVTFGEEYILSDSPYYDIGYPSTVELDNGDLVTVHYQIYGDDDKASVLYTKWRP